MDDQTVVIDQVVSANVTSTRFELGASAPVHAGASGRVVLAYLDPARYKKLLRFPRLPRLTERTITNRCLLEMERTKWPPNGFTVSRGARSPDTWWMAGPVF